MSPETVTLGDVVKTIGDLGVIGLLIVLLWGGIKKWWVFGWAYDQIVIDRDEWKEMALKGIQLAARTVDAVDVVTRIKRE